jgi:hypothetical protein
VKTSAEAAADWLASQPESSLRIAREIITRRAVLQNPGPASAAEDLVAWPGNDLSRRYEEGMLAGLRLALSYLGDRPGDISQTGAEGYLTDVEFADRMKERGPE